MSFALNLKDRGTVYYPLDPSGDFALPGKDQDSFVQLRDARDAQLSMPKLLIPSLQVNMRAGNMPQADENGDVYLKVPINKM